ncbi:hypothetical protein C1645_879058, partial [Glomus cerebriforme]
EFDVSYEYAAEDFVENNNKIQCSTNGSGGSANIKECPFFGGVSVKKDKRECQGIKYCQFSDPEFINQEHCNVDFEEIFRFIL